jgi:hypothetical protein
VGINASHPLENQAQPGSCLQLRYGPPDRPLGSEGGGSVGDGGLDDSRSRVDTKSSDYTGRATGAVELDLVQPEAILFCCSPESDRLPPLPFFLPSPACTVRREG